MTGLTKSYNKPGLEFCGGADTSAFALGPVAVSSKVVGEAVTAESGHGGMCGESLLCLVGGRFQVELVARDPRSGAVAEGVAIPRTGDFGYFSLPGLTGNASNPEVFVKVLDITFCSNNHPALASRLKTKVYFAEITVNKYCIDGNIA